MLDTAYHFPSKSEFIFLFHNSEQNPQVDINETAEPKTTFKYKIYGTLINRLRGTMQQVLELITCS